MEASRPNRVSGTAGRRISGSPRSRRRPRGRGTRSSRATARRRSAARSRAKSPCARAEPPPPRATRGSVWPLRNTWNRATENLYSAWIEKLFDAPLDAALSWPALHEVLRDRSRNFLFNHLGLRRRREGAHHSPRLRRPSVLFARVFRVQDGAAVRVLEVHARRRRRAAEVPAVVEHSESRSLAPAPPEQDDRVRRGLFADASASQPRRPRPELPPRPQGLVPGFGYYLRTTVADGVHSGNGRTAASDDNTDYYPVPLNEETLRPGTVYADPYGHILVLARRVPQSGDAAGVLLAVDAQPDGTVARKRFWRGNFLFAQDPALGSPGFKRFRPIVREKNGALAAADQRRNREKSAVRRFFARSVAARGRRLLRSNG